MRRLAIACAALWFVVSLGAARSLDIYFIDVEGGQSTLIATPGGESLLIDTGYASDGRFGSLPGPITSARDANRVLAAARAAGITRVDNLLITHFHADHDGGVPELASQLPILRFIDHGAPPSLTEENVEGTIAAFNAYAGLRAKGQHLEPKPGDRLSIGGAEVTVVSAAGAVLSRPLRGA